jgi:hypothetical protein
MGDERVLSNGTSCYQNSFNDNTNNSGAKFKEEYKIPHLERRTRTWIYQTSFVLNKVKSAPFHDMDNFSTKVYRRTRKQKETNADENMTPPTIQHLLVVEGIKMGASVAVNGITIGNMTNQFMRRIFPLPNSILHFHGEQENILTVTFDPEIDTHGRFMACSGGWDWAPYSMAAEASCSSRRVFSFGIFKPIYIVQVNRVVVLHVVPKVRYVGNPLIHPLGGKFELDVDVHLQVARENSHSLRNDHCGEVVLRTPFGKDQIKMLRDCNVGSINSTTMDHFFECVITWKMDIVSIDVDLWWPHGSGNQTLYTIQVLYRDLCRGSSSKWIKRQIGNNRLSSLFCMLIVSPWCNNSNSF